MLGGGPAGIAAATEAGRAGHEVVLLERGERLGGQIALAGAAPAGRELARRFLADAERQLAAAGVEVRLGSDGARRASSRTRPCWRRARVRTRTTGSRSKARRYCRPGTCSRGQLPEGERIVVADWGGDPSGLDAAEVLAAAGKQVTLATASVAVGELVHQYRRNLYLQRLYRAGVEVVHHHRLESADRGAVRLRNVFAPELVTVVEADGLVLALGRVPLTVPEPEGVIVERAGDCLSPRSLEEAVLEGTLAARRALDRVGSR